MPKFARPNQYTGKQSTQSWTGSVRAANSVEAAAGQDPNLYISPATLASAVGTLVPSASATVEGSVYLTEGTSSIAYPVATKFYADNLAIAGAPAWSETVSGIGQLATTLEATTGTNDNVAMTPLKVAQVLAGGGSSPSFTDVLISGTLGVSGLATLSGSATVTTGATALNLASDASTGAVNIGTGAGARTITVGNITGATALVLNSGTGGIALASTTSGDITLNSADTVLIDSAGVLELNSSAGVIGIGNDAVAQNINMGTGAAQRVITIGNSTSASQVVINSGTAGINIGTNAVAMNVSIGNQTGASAVAIDSGTGSITIGTAVAKTITIGNVTGATAVNINAGSGGSLITTTNSALGLVSGTGTVSISADAAATTINIGTGAAVVKTISIGGTGANVIRIGDTQTGGSLSIGAALTTGTLVLGSTAAGTGTVTLAGGTGAQTINIANSTGGKTINIGAGAGANVITIGSVTGASGIAMLVGTGNYSLDGAATSTYTFAPSTTSGTINFGGTGANTGTATILGGTGAQTINIANSTGGKTIAFGTGAGANAITIGSTNTTSATVLQAGSGDVRVTSANLRIATTGKGLQIKGGAATDFVGSGTLSSGTVTILNTNIATGDLIFLSRIAAGASTTLGVLSYTISNATSFTVTSLILGTPGSTQTGDVSTFAYQIIRPL